MSTQLRHMAVTAILLGSGLSRIPSAQAKLPFDGRRLLAATDTFVANYSGSPIGRGIGRLERRQEGGTSVWHQAYAFRAANGAVSTDTLVVDALTLRPIREVRTSDLGRFEIAYGRGEVTTRQFVAGKPPTVTRDTLGPSTLATAALQAVAQSFDHVLNARAELDLYNPAPGPARRVRGTVQVVRSEDVPDRSGGRRAAWVVEARVEGDVTTYWIDRASRAVLRYQTTEGPALIEFHRP